MAHFSDCKFWLWGLSAKSADISLLYPLVILLSFSHSNFVLLLVLLRPSSEICFQFLLCSVAISFASVWCLTYLAIFEPGSIRYACTRFLRFMHCKLCPIYLCIVLLFHVFSLKTLQKSFPLARCASLAMLGSKSRKRMLCLRHRNFELNLGKRGLDKHFGGQWFQSLTSVSWSVLSF